jgi:annexin A7/11
MQNLQQNPQMPGQPMQNLQQNPQMPGQPMQNLQQNPQMPGQPMQYPPQMQGQPYPPYAPQHYQPGVMGYGAPPPQTYVQNGTPNLLSAQQLTNDVESLRKAMKGLGTNETALIALLGSKTPLQMEQVTQAYKASYGRDLSSDLASEVSGNFKNLCVGLTLNFANYDAICCREAIKGMGTDEAALIQTLAGRTNAEIYCIKQAYFQMFRTDLETDLAGDLGGSLKRLFLGLIQGQRDETNQIIDIERDLDTLYKAGEGKWGTDESAFLMIFNTRSYAHLKKLFASYLQKYQKTIEKVIKSEFSGDMERALLAIG